MFRQVVNEGAHRIADLSLACRHDHLLRRRRGDKAQAHALHHQRYGYRPGRLRPGAYGEAGLPALADPRGGIARYGQHRLEPVIVNDGAGGAGQFRAAVLGIDH